MCKLISTFKKEKEKKTQAWNESPNPPPKSLQQRNGHLSIVEGILLACVSQGYASEMDSLALMFVFLQNQLPGGHLPHAGVADVELYHLPGEKAAGEEQCQQEGAIAQQEEAH